MHKQLSLFLMVVSCALAAPQRRNGFTSNGGSAPQRRNSVAPNGGPESTAVIINQDQQVNPDGSYSFIYETSNGIKAAESSPDGASATGEFSYTAPEGEKIQLTYAADQGGFQPQGAHLPVEPPVPDHVIRGLEIIKANPPKDPDFDPVFLDTVIARLRALQG
ncbi:endocuticle structural glycoprotein ABD-4-like [Malaya genurostris]|uniref:endocuticle structural glycoprotein ABD-4-like n=1 Tax=Malaya genurostris TaxID=325434 RepID=UPI0026F38428|nr:endocuticle structural glycoprotein ABD-4-like [Malaya genurostris]